MAQNPEKLHLCNVKGRRLCGGEQPVLVILKVLYCANKGIEAHFRINPLFG